MRKLQEVLRLRFKLKPGYQQIGRSCAIGVSTVHKYLKRAEAAGLSWPLPEGWKMKHGWRQRCSHAPAQLRRRNQCARHPISPRSTSSCAAASM